MTEITRSFSAKVGVALVAAAMAFSAMAVPAQAQQTPEELQQMINDLLAQISTLQGQLGQGESTAGGPAGVCPYTWTRSLSQGDRGEDVKRLQQFLNSNPDHRVAATGPGSAGMETEFYGPATAAAVSAMQVMYRAEILTPNGLQNPTGFFGPSSRAKANELCVAAPAPAPAPMPEDDDDDMMEDDDDMMDEEEEDLTGGPLRGGEATLTTFRLRTGEESVAREGQSDVPVLELELEVEDGDAAINRLDLNFARAGANASTGETRPWENFRSIALWVDGNKMAEVDADRRSDWTRSSDSDRIRMTGLDIVLREDQRTDVVIAVTPRSTIRGLADSVYTWGIEIPNNGFRMRDSLGIDTFDGGEGPETFDLEEAGADDELRVRDSNNDPRATTIEVDSDRRSSWANIFTFDLDTRDSINEIEIFEIPVNMTLSEDYQDVISDLRLEVDGRTYRDFSVDIGVDTDAFPGDDGTPAEPIVTFTFDDELFVRAGDRVEARLMARFNAQQGNYPNGTTIQSEVVAYDGGPLIRAEGANRLNTSSQLGGSSLSETHTLRTEGVVSEMTSSSANVVTRSDEDDEGQFNLTLEVTAIGDDVLVDEDIFSNVEAGDWQVSDGSGIAFVVTDRDGGVVENDSDISSDFRRVSGGNRVSDGRYRISEGSTATFELIVNYRPEDDNVRYRVQLEALGFFVDGDTDAQAEVFSPRDEFRTDSVNLRQASI